VKRATLVFTVMVFCAAAAPGAQKPAPPSQPAVEAPPTWSRVLHMPDGRTFVTDGGLAIDAAIAKPATLPTAVVQSAAVFARHLTAPYDQEIALGDLRTGTRKNTFVAPNGVVLNGNYVNFLRRTAPAGRVRLRVKGEFDPIVIVVDREPVGVLMAVRSAK
jgi:hypothetical protein